MSIHQTPNGNWFVKHYVAQKEKRKDFDYGPDAKQAVIDFNILFYAGPKPGQKELLQLTKPFEGCN